MSEALDRNLWIQDGVQRGKSYRVGLHQSKALFRDEFTTEEGEYRTRQELK